MTAVTQAAVKPLVKTSSWRAGADITLYNGEIAWELEAGKDKVTGGAWMLAGDGHPANVMPPGQMPPSGGAYRRLRHKHFQNITPSQTSPAGSIEKYLWDKDQKNTGQDTRLDGHDTRLTNAENKNGQQDTRLDGHDTRLTNAENKNDQQDTRLDGHDTRFTNVENKNTQQDTRLDSAENKNTEQDSRLEDAEDGLNAHKTDPAAHEDIRAEIDLKAPIDSPVFTGIPEVTDPALNDYSVPMQASPVRDRLYLHDFVAETSGGYLRALDGGGVEPYDRRIDRTEEGREEFRDVDHVEYFVTPERWDELYALVMTASGKHLRFTGGGVLSWPEGGVIEARLNRLLDALPGIKILRELDVNNGGGGGFEGASWIALE